MLTKRTVKRILELESYKNDCDSVKDDIFGFDITNISVCIFDYFENNNNIEIYRDIINIKI